MSRTNKGSTMSAVGKIRDKKARVPKYAFSLGFFVDGKDLGCSFPPLQKDKPTEQTFGSTGIFK